MDRFKAWLKLENLTLVGVVRPDIARDVARYEQWLKTPVPKDLAYLERNRAVYQDLNLILPEVRSIVVFALAYYSPEEWGCRPQVARYARFSDYHKLMRIKGQRVADKLTQEWGGTARVVVDSAPVLERALAAKSSSGFIGKNTCFIDPVVGSFLLLGEILTTASLPSYSIPPEIPLDRKTSHGGCGPCNLCQVHCPTGALHSDYSLDVGKCLAYWTIENQGPIPEEFWPYLKDYWFGCDICQTICPYNVKATDNQLPEEIKRRTYPDLPQVATMDQPFYEKHFGGTPLTRAKRNGLRRNALIAMVVTRHPLLERALEQARLDPAEPVGETLNQIRRYLKSCTSQVRLGVS